MERGVTQYSSNDGAVGVAKCRRVRMLELVVVNSNGVRSLEL